MRTRRTQGNQPSTGSSSVTKDVSRGDCPSPIDTIVRTPTSDDQLNSAAGTSNHGAIARVAFPRNTSDNSASDSPISLAMARSTSKGPISICRHSPMTTSTTHVAAHHSSSAPKKRARDQRHVSAIAGMTGHRCSTAMGITRR